MSFHKVLVLGAASWNRKVYVTYLPQGSSATVFDAHEAQGVGSTGVGKSMVLSALGFKPTLHCALGRDHHATKIRTECEARQIELIVPSCPAEMRDSNGAGDAFSVAFWYAQKAGFCLREAGSFVAAAAAYAVESFALFPAEISVESINRRAEIL